MNTNKLLRLTNKLERELTNFIQNKDEHTQPSYLPDAKKARQRLRWIEAFIYRVKNNLL